MIRKALKATTMKHRWQARAWGLLVLLALWSGGVAEAATVGTPAADAVEMPVPGASNLLHGDSEAKIGLQGRISAFFRVHFFDLQWISVA